MDEVAETFLLNTTLTEMAVKQLLLTIALREAGVGVQRTGSIGTKMLQTIICYCDKLNAINKLLLWLKQQPLSMSIVYNIILEVDRIYSNMIIMLSMKCPPRLTIHLLCQLNHHLWYPLRLGLINTVLYEHVTESL